MLPLLLVSLALSMPGQAQSFTRTIPGTSNIFGAGGSLIGDGTLPVCINKKFKAKTALIFDSVTGGVNCGGDGSKLATPDGTGGCGFSRTSVSSPGPIGSVRLPGNLFLLGVFTRSDPQAGKDGEDADDDFADDSVLAPQINTPFFIGDGLTGDGVGEKQRFRIPKGAGRLCFGFADALGFGGSPGYYSDNVGAIDVQFRVVDDDKFTISGLVKGNLLPFIADEPIVVRCRDGFEKTVRTDAAGKYSLQVPKGRCTIRPKTSVRFPSSFTPISSADAGNRAFTPQVHSQIVENDTEGLDFTTILYQGVATTIRNPVGGRKNCALGAPKDTEQWQVDNLPRGLLLTVTTADRLNPSIFKVKPEGPFDSARLSRGDCIGVKSRSANIGAPISFLGSGNITPEGDAALPVQVEYGG